MALEQVQKGWLKTREDVKFAPKTFTQNIIDATANKTLNVILENTTNNINSIVGDLEEVLEKTENIGIDGSDERLFIVDKNDNVIAYFDSTGIHSVDYYVGNSTNPTDSLSGVIDNLKNFDGTDNDKLYFIDANDNVIAYIDKDGIHSIEFTNKSGVTLDGLKQNINSIIGDIEEANSKITTNQTNINDLNSRLKTAENELSYIDLPTEENTTGISLINASLDDDKLYFIDKNDNVIAFITDDGIHSVEFTNKQGLTLTGLQSSINSIIGDLEETTNLAKANQTNIGNLDSRLIITENELSYLDFPVVENTNNITLLGASLDDDKFYFIDKNDNVIAYVDSTGIHSIEFINKQGLTLDGLQSSINSVAGDLAETNSLVNNLQTKAMNATANFTGGTKIGSITMGTLAASQNIDLYTPIPSITDNFTNEAKVLVATFNYNGSSTKIYAPDVTENLNSIIGDLEETNELVEALQLQAISVTDSVTAANKLQIGSIKIGTLTNSNTVGLYTPVPSITEVYSDAAKVKIGTFNYNGTTTTLYAPDDTAKINSIIGDLEETTNLAKTNQINIGNLDSRLIIAENELSYIDLPTTTNSNGTTLISSSLDDNKLYFIDSGDNVIAYIDDTGVHGIEFTNKSGITLDGLRTDISGLAGDINEMLPFLIPAYSTADNGKVLAIINGKPTWVSQFDDF